MWQTSTKYRAMVVLVSAMALFACMSFAMAQDEDDANAPEMETTIEGFEVPPSKVAPHELPAFDAAIYRATAEEEKEIARMIERLIDIDKPDYGMAPMMSGSQFAPIASSRQFNSGIIMVDHGLDTATMVRRLVELGPKAMPALLKALDDATPTKYSMKHSGGFGAMWPSREVPCNLGVPVEADANKELHAGWTEDHFGLGTNLTQHDVTRGDMCFVIIGQIVNRNYQAVRYQPTACNVINSPTRDPAIATAVRAMWQSEDSPRRLFESLVNDFHGRGGAAELQAGAAMRLLYYFPNESKQLIADRLDKLDVMEFKHADTDGDYWEHWRTHFAANGETRVAEFVEAIAYTDVPEVTKAISRVMARTDDPYIFAACLTEGVAEVDPELMLNRMADIVAVAPPVGQGPFGGEYHTLIAAANLFPEKSRPLFDSYLAHGTLESRRAAIHALDKPVNPVPWAVAFLEPLLDDQTDTGWEYGANYDRHPIRVCDEAAKALTAHVPGATMVFEGPTSDLDLQIANMKRVIAGEPIIEKQDVQQIEIDFDLLPVLEPIASHSFELSLGSVFDFSNPKTIYCGVGYSADCWAYGTLTIDGATGDILDRVQIDEWKGAVSFLRPMSGTIGYCYHGEAQGDVVARDLRTGKELKRVATPFHYGVGFDDPLQVRNLSDVFMTHDQKWIIAITPDGALHSVNMETGEHEQVWKHAGESRFPGHGMHGTLTPVQGTNRMLVEFLFEDDPISVWDQDARSMTQIKKVPSGGWRSAWGKYALNAMNNQFTLWNLEEGKQIELPLPEGIVVADVACSHDMRSILVVVENGGAIVFDLETNTSVARIEAAKGQARFTIQLSQDDRWLFRRADFSTYNEETGERENQMSSIDVYELPTATSP